MKTNKFHHLIGVTLLSVAPTCDAVGTSTIMNQVAGYWQFDETAGNIAYEASGRGYDGQLINYPGNQGSWVAGQMGGALEFGGLAAQQYVQVPDFTKPTSSMSLSAWIYADSLPQWATIAANWNGLYGMLHYGMYGSDPFLSLYFAVPGQQPGIGIETVVENGSIFQVPPLSLGQWHHVAMVVDGPFRRATLYRDGRRSGWEFLVGSTFYPAPVDHLNIGGEPTFDNPNQGYWDGKIDDLALWTRALTEEEVMAIYFAGVEGNSLMTLVPEPGSLALALGGAGGLLALRRRRASR